MTRPHALNRHPEAPGGRPGLEGCTAKAGADHPSRLSRPQAGVAPQDRQRIDKWLWHARLVRTRSAAAALVEAGVRLNGKRITAASHLVRRGDVLAVALDRSLKILQVAAFCERRGNASAARALYRDLTGSGPDIPA